MTVDRTYLVVDIETVLDRAMGWDPAKEGFAPPPFHEVVAVGALWLEPDLTFRRIGVFGVPHGGAGHQPPEGKVLEDFTAFVGRARPHLVTYNGRRFDLPVLCNRCLRHGVPFGLYYSDREYRYRYSELGHIDLADLLTDHGAAAMSKLDAVARLVGLPGKMGVDGSQVENLHERGETEQLQAYCLQDVVQTAFLFLRIELLRGRLDRPTYRARAEGLWDALGDDARVTPVLEAADRARLLLEA